MCLIKYYFLINMELHIFDHPIFLFRKAFLSLFLSFLKWYYADSWYRSAQYVRWLFENGSWTLLWKNWAWFSFIDRYVSDWHWIYHYLGIISWCHVLSRFKHYWTFLTCRHQFRTLYYLRRVEGIGILS